MPLFPHSASHILLEDVGNLKAGTPVYPLALLEPGVVRIAPARAIYGDTERVETGNILEIRSDVSAAIDLQLADLNQWKEILTKLAFEHLKKRVREHNIRWIQKDSTGSVVTYGASLTNLVVEVRQHIHKALQG